MRFFSSQRGTRSKAGRRKRPKTRSQQRRAYRPLFEILEDRLALAVIAWDGEAGNNDWNSALNWVGNVAPGSADDAQIGSIFAAQTINYTSLTSTVQSVTTAAQLTMSGGFLTITANSTFNNAVTVSGTGSLTLGGTGSLTNAAGGTVNLTSSAVNLGLNNQSLLAVRGSNTLGSDAGTFTTAPTSDIRVFGGLTVANGFTNNGVIDLNNEAINASSSLTVTSGTLTNAAGASINVKNDGGGNGNRTLTAQLDNQGFLNLSAEDLSPTKTGADHFNSGAINLTGGDLTVSQTGTTPSFSNSGAIVVGSGATFAVSGGAFHQQAGSLGGSGGTLAFSSNASATFDVPFNTTGQTLTLNLATYGGSGLLTHAPTGTMTLTSSTINAPFDNQGPLTVRGSNTLGTAAGLFTTNGSSDIRVFGGLTVANGFTNNGVIDLNNEAINASSSLTVTSGTLTNAAGASINVKNDGGGNGNRTLTAQLDNQGFLNLSAEDLSLTKTGADHLNSGAINLTGGDLTVSQTGTTPSFSNSGAIVVGSGGAFHQQAGSLGGTLAFSSNAIATFDVPFNTTGQTLTLNLATYGGSGLLTHAPTGTMTLTSSTINAPSTTRGR